MEFIETTEELRQVYGHASATALKKQLQFLDSHSKNFLARSPFAAVGTQSPDGFGDVTPRGDQPGFALVLDDRTIALPDRPGNNRLDTLENVLHDPRIGLLFMIPGMNETLRINGTARVTTDADLCQRLNVKGRPALSAMVVSVKEVYMHCSKAYIRSGLWKPDTWMDRKELPTFGQILRDQAALSVQAEQIDRSLEENYREDLW